MKSSYSKLSTSVLFVAIALSFFSFETAANPEKAERHQPNSHDDGASDDPGVYSVRQLTLASDSVSAAPTDSGFDWGGDCDAGSGEFSQLIAYRQVETIGVVPDNKRNIFVQLESSSDIDIRLIDVATNTELISWPNGLLNGPTEECTEFQDTHFCYSGYNGVGGELGNEWFSVKGQPRALRLDAFAYATGDADVSYSFSPITTCNEKGEGSIQLLIEQGAITEIGIIPEQKVNVRIELETEDRNDVDVQLRTAKSGEEIVAWPDGLMPGPAEQSVEYMDMLVGYSGYNGVNGNRGFEWIRVEDLVTTDLAMSVYGYRAGQASIRYSWGEGAGEACTGGSDTSCTGGLVCKTGVNICHSPNWCMSDITVTQHCGSGTYSCKQFECKASISVTSVFPDVVTVGANENFSVWFNAGASDNTDLSRYDIRFANATDDYDLSNPNANAGLPYEALGGGQFLVTVSGFISGTRRLIITDKVSQTEGIVDLMFLPGTPSEIEILDIIGPGGRSNRLDERIYDLAVTDEHGNTIPDIELMASATFGDFEFTANEDGSIRAVLVAKGYGHNDILFRTSYPGGEIELSDEVQFHAVGLGNNNGYAVDGKNIHMPILTNFPDLVCQGLEEVNFSFVVPPGMELVNAKMNTNAFIGKLIIAPNMMGQTVVSFNGGLRDIIREGGCVYPDPAGDIFLQPIDPGTYYLVAGGGYTLVTNTDDPEAAAQEVCNEEVECEVRNVTIAETHLIIITTPETFDPTYGTGKPVKNICLDFIVSPHADYPLALGPAVIQTEEIFKDNAAQCRCPGFIRIESYRVHYLDEEEWGQSFGRRSSSKMPNPNKVKAWLDNPGDALYQRRGMCTPVFITDMPRSVAKGRHVRGGSLDYANAENFIILDHTKAFNTNMRTLAHELGHAFSNGGIVDSSHPDGHSQGTNRQNNLYNYRSNGTNMTANQCNRIDWDHSRFNNPPD